MKQFLLTVALVLMAWLALAIYAYRDCPHVWARLCRTALHLKYTPAPDTKFYFVHSAGYERTALRATPGGSHGIGRSSDCVDVLYKVYIFETPSDAEATLRDWKRLASSVAGSGQKVVPGQGESLVLKMPDEKGFLVIAKWVFLAIQSESLDHALPFEKYHRQWEFEWQKKYQGH
jgi:hypothetical protein